MHFHPCGWSLAGVRQCESQMSGRDPALAYSTTASGVDLTVTPSTPPWTTSASCSDTRGKKQSHRVGVMSPYIDVGRTTPRSCMVKKSHKVSCSLQNLAFRRYSSPEAVPRLLRRWNILSQCLSRKCNFFDSQTNYVFANTCMRLIFPLVSDLLPQPHTPSTSHDLK